MGSISRVTVPPTGFVLLARRRLSFPDQNPGTVEVLAKMEGFVTEQMQPDIRAAIAAGLTPPGDPSTPFVYTAEPVPAQVTDTGASADVAVWYKPLGGNDAAGGP